MIGVMVANSLGSSPKCVQRWNYYSVRVEEFVQFGKELTRYHNELARMTPNGLLHQRLESAFGN